MPMRPMTKDEKDPRMFDTRVVERNIQKGVVTRKDYDKYLKTLGDLREKAIVPGDASVGAADDDHDEGADD